MKLLVEAVEEVLGAGFTVELGGEGGSKKRILRPVISLNNNT